MIKTIAVDLDGTLIDSSQNIQPKTKEALIKLQDEGIRLILVSGRPFRSMVRHAESLGISKHHGVILSNNGGLAYDFENKKIIFDSPMDSKLVREILEEAKDNDIMPVLEDGDYLLAEDIEAGMVNWRGSPKNMIIHEAEIGGFKLKEVRPLTKVADLPYNRILAIVEPANMDRVLPYYIEKYKGRLNVDKSAPSHLQITDPNVSKANGLKRMGVDPETLMAFGDSINDISMLKFAKISVAMGRAEDEVKAIASYTTTSEDDEGIYRALVHFGLIEE